MDHCDKFDENSDPECAEREIILKIDTKQWKRIGEKQKSESLFNIIAFTTTLVAILLFVVSLGLIIYKLQADITFLQQEILTLKDILDVNNIYAKDYEVPADEYASDDEPEYFDRDDNEDDVTAAPYLIKSGEQLAEDVHTKLPIPLKVPTDKIHQSNDLKIQPSIRQQAIFGSLAVHEILNAALHQRNRRAVSNRRSFEPIGLAASDCTNANQFIGAHYKAASKKRLESCSSFMWESQISSKCHQPKLSDGYTIKIKRSGVYFIYAQLFYNHSRVGSGFAVQQQTGDNHPVNILKCSIQTHSVSTKEHSLSNSCYVAGLALVREGDTIRIHPNYQHEMCLNDNDKSYLGLFKVADLDSIE